MSFCFVTWGNFRELTVFIYQLKSRGEGEKHASRNDNIVAKMKISGDLFLFLGDEMIFSGDGKITTRLCLTKFLNKMIIRD